MRTRKSSKGLFNAEYITVLVLFIMFSTYFTYKLVEQRPTYLREVNKEMLRSESYRLSEMLINDPGYPNDWNTLVGGASEANIKRIALLDQSENETNLLSTSKISGLNTLCLRANGYENVKRLVGAAHDFSILVINSTEAPKVLIDCKPSATGEVVASIKRLVAFGSGNFGEMVVQMW